MIFKINIFNKILNNFITKIRYIHNSNIYEKNIYVKTYEI